MDKILSFVFLFTVTLFFLKQAISGLTRGKIEFHLRGKDTFYVYKDKARFFALLFLLAAAVLGWATVSLVAGEF